MIDIEIQYSKISRQKGYLPLRCGYPDFLLVNKKGNIIATEVKSDTDRLSMEQIVCLYLLQKVGATVRIYDSNARKFPGRLMSENEMRLAEDFLKAQVAYKSERISSPLSTTTKQVSDPEQKLTLSVEDAAKQLGVSSLHLYKQIKENKFPCVIKMGHRLLIPIAAFNKWLESNGTLLGNES